MIRLERLQPERDGSCPVNGIGGPILEQHRAKDRIALGPVVLSAVLLGMAGIATTVLTALGPLSGGMVLHILLMNVAAPLLAALPTNRSTPRHGGAPVAALVQMLTLWAWHAPALQSWVVPSAAAHLLLLAILLGSAVWFWRAVLAAGRAYGWQAVATLLLTGKFACLLGALLIFAPRDIYGLPGFAAGLCFNGPSTLEDQQLAGLLMITACPLSYVVAGVGLAASMLARLDDEPLSDVAARTR